MNYWDAMLNYFRLWGLVPCIDLRSDPADAYNRRTNLSVPKGRPERSWHRSMHTSACRR